MSAEAVATFSLVCQRWRAQSGPMKPSCPRRLPPPQHCAHAVRPDPRQSLHHDGHTPRERTARSPFSRPAPSQRAQRARPAPPHALHALPRAAATGSASTMGGCCGRTRTRAAGGGGLMACTTVCVATDAKPSRKPADAASTTVSIMAQLRSSRLHAAALCLCEHPGYLFLALTQPWSGAAVADGHKLAGRSGGASERPTASGTRPNR